MKANLSRLIPLFVGAACATTPHLVQAQDSNAHLYVAHAASGRNISSTTNPGFPVDISVGGHCIVQGASFGDIRGPFTLPPGTYALRVSVADAINPCGNAAFYSPSIPLTAGNTSLGILTLNSSNQPVGEIVAVNLSPVPVGEGRLVVVNTTHEALTGTLTVEDTSASPVSASVAAGAVLVTTVPAGEYSATIYPEGSNTRATGPSELTIGSRNVHMIVLAGSTANNSIQFLGPEVIRDVF